MNFKQLCDNTPSFVIHVNVVLCSRNCSETSEKVYVPFSMFLLFSFEY